MNRRRFLEVTVTTGALTGCLGSGEEAEDGAFIETEVNGLYLDVEFTEDSDIRQVNAIQDGELVTQASLAAGESRASLPLVDYRYDEVQGMVPPGEHTFVATDADGEEHKHDLTIEPASEIVDVSVLEDYPRRLAFRIENTGTGPDAVVTGEELPEPFGVEDGASK